MKIQWFPTNLLGRLVAHINMSIKVQVVIVISPNGTYWLYHKALMIYLICTPTCLRTANGLEGTNQSGMLYNYYIML